MKNIHILPTDKPSRLHFDSKLFLSPNYQDSKTINSIVEGRNIYITSDEKIKDGYFLDLTYNIVMKSVFYPSSDKNCKKIILTTDQDLIKDGVQAIDDEFLEWFIKNPSCEEVEVETMMECEKCGKEYCDNLNCRGYKDILYYKIIIPKEELTFENSIDNTMNIMSIANSMFGKKEEPKQESLSWDELIREAGSEEQLIKILKLPHIAPLVREAMKNECKK